MAKNGYREAFLEALEDIYGPYSFESALFGSTNYSKISAELCYSNSHFTKLISGGATDAMYKRALKNTARIKNLHELKAQVSAFTESKSKRSFKPLILILAAALLALMFSKFIQNNKNDVPSTNLDGHPLDMYFNLNDAHYYKSPYLSEEQVHEYCPGSAYEGRWELVDQYIIPIPYKIPGIYYVGKSADIRLKCKKTAQNDKGSELIGFENITNEIWFDKSMTPISPDYFNKATNSFTEKFENLDLENDANFVRIANVYSCFYDEISITKDSIYRRGEPCGRFANAENENILQQYNLDLNHIIEYVIGSMTFAKCEPIKNEYCDPNDLLNGESVLEFPCKCSIKTENLGLGGSYPYTKSIKLYEQNYQSNLLCGCD